MSKASEYHEKLRAINGGEWFDFEGLVRDIYLSILKPGDVALDIGFNRGDHLLQMAERVGGKGLAIGVEAAPKMVELTKSFFLAGGLATLNNVSIHNVAVADKEGTAIFQYVVDQPGLSSLARRQVAEQYEVQPIETRVTTIDILLADVPRVVNFVKFDIGGAEYSAFEGANRLFMKDRCPLVFEYDNSAPTYFEFLPEEFVQFFSSRGYKICDFFGFEYKTAADLEQSRVWNYFAAPIEKFDLYQVPEVVRASLKANGIYAP